MPAAFTPRLQIASDAVIGTRKSKDAEYWYIRFYYKRTKEYDFQSLGLKFEEGIASQKLARDKAQLAYEKKIRNVEAGLAPNAKLTPKFILNEYRKHIQQLTAENEARDLPINRVEGGRGYWNKKRLSDAERQLDYVEQFLTEELPKELHKIRQRDLELFIKWAHKHHEWAPATINRALVQLRMLWRHAHNKGYVDFIPQISQEPQQLVERTRRKLKPDEYFKIVEVSRGRYESIVRSKGDKDLEKMDLYYQFHLWLLIMSNSGIRPPAGGEERLLLRWSDIHERGNGKERFLLRRSEKAHLNYEAVILPNAHEYLDALKQLQDMRGVETEYIFAHTFDNPAKGGKGWNKGDPIKSFRKQWHTTLKLAGLDSPPGTPQRSKLVPYSLRAWFMTNRLEASDTLRIEDLAKATGSSPEIIAKLYYDYNTRKRYEEITKGNFNRADLKPIYVDGIYIGRTSSTDG